MNLLLNAYFLLCIMPISSNLIAASLHHDTPKVAAIFDLRAQEKDLLAPSPSSRPDSNWSGRPEFQLAKKHRYVTPEEAELNEHALEVIQSLDDEELCIFLRDLKDNPTQINICFIEEYCRIRTLDDVLKSNISIFVDEFLELHDKTDRASGITYKATFCSQFHKGYCNLNHFNTGPVYYALLYHNFYLAKVLLEHNFKFDNPIDDKNHTLLHLAARAGDINICRFLVEEAGVSTESVNILGQKPIDFLPRGADTFPIRVLLTTHETIHTALEKALPRRLTFRQAPQKNPDWNRAEEEIPLLNLKECRFYLPQESCKTPDSLASSCSTESLPERP